MTTVSVLMPVFNGAAHIAEAIESVIGQQGAPDFELVVINDGSTDETPDILRCYDSARYLRVEHTENHGIARALAFGVQLCRGRYICRLDADDLMSPGRLRAQAGFLDQHPDIHLVSGTVRHEVIEGDKNGGMARYVDWMNRQISHEEMLQSIWIDSPVAHPSVMFRREAIASAGGYQDVPWPEDTDLWFRMFLCGMRFAKLDSETVIWRDHPKRLTRIDHHYGQEQQAAMKAHYLPRFFPRARQHGVTVLGAGPFGKRLGRALKNSGVSLRRFVDIDPRKISRIRLGVEVMSLDSLNPTLPELLVAAVGSAGARDEIERDLQARGFLVRLGSPMEATTVVFCH